MATTRDGSPGEPWLLHLPHRALRVGLDVARIARARGDLRDPRELEYRFGLHSHERRFVRELLAARTQLWVFRCDQLRSCGDLVVVDMSAPRALRRCVVVELKQRVRVRAAPKHVQLANHATAIAELAARGIVDPDPPVTALLGEVGVGTLAS
ncbi:hypothetical protein [Sandaracinus amylolyticus]|uniref:hypothetical protein n=1 Tax=Sandaracinus amylolyticus TaxID=927083 RepID=UPI001F423331|nr:hypothetical protein [Sandaracinus amylolyticus]UJR86240.1 Hypothetical protein I5071_83220 [Sandaracinus amylolyticus]